MSNISDSHQAQHLVAPDLGQTVCIGFQQMTPGGKSLTRL